MIDSFEPKPKQHNLHNIIGYVKKFFFAVHLTTKTNSKIFMYFFNPERLIGLFKKIIELGYNLENRSNYDFFLSQNKLIMVVADILYQALVFITIFVFK